MSYAINAVDTADTMPDSATTGTTRNAYLECPRTVKLNIWILNNGAMVQMGGSRGVGPEVSQAAANWRPEVFLPPGMYSFIRQIERIRFRSSASGLPANVTVEALVAGE